MNDLKRRNVYWFLIDGLSPDFLSSCGAGVASDSFFDSLLRKGCTFSNVASVAAGTHTSMHAVFSSMYPSINGASGWDKRALRRFNHDIFTITDLFKMSGYHTFRYGDADGERDVPMSGFDVWESSGFPISSLLQKTDYTETERRRNFISLVNATNGPKFVYHHSLILHETNARLGRVWSTNGYCENILFSAEHFHRCFTQYDITDDDIIILSSDHGVILDKDWMQDGLENGERHYEQSVRTFFSVISRDISPRLIDTPISSLDEAITLCDLVLNITMPGQGKTRASIIRGETPSPGDEFFLREKGTYTNDRLKNGLCSDTFYIKDTRYKYVFSVTDPRCEWLIDLKKHGDYVVNLRDVAPETVKEYKKLLSDALISPSVSVESIYKDHSFTLRKDNLPKKYTILLESRNATAFTLNSLLDMSGPYYDIVVTGTSELLVQGIKSSPDELKDIDPGSLSGEYIVVLTRPGEYSEYFLSDINIMVNGTTDTNTMFTFSAGYVICKDNFRSKSVHRKPCSDIRVFALTCTKKRKHILDSIYLSKSHPRVDFYLTDVFEIDHFLPFYRNLSASGVSAFFIAEPPSRNVSGTWFNYNAAISRLNSYNVEYRRKVSRGATIAFTTQTVNCLRKYPDNTIKINLSYGYGFIKSYFIHSERSVRGFDYRFVHGPAQKRILSGFMDEDRIIEVGYPKFATYFKQRPIRVDVLKDLGITTEKPIITYFPTWDDESSIKQYIKMIQALRDKYYIVIKPHHCTTLEKNHDDYLQLKDTADCLLDPFFDMGKAALIGDIAICDAKSGASLEVSYLNESISIIVLLNEPLNEDKYNSTIKDFFVLCENPAQLKVSIRKVLDNGDPYRNIRNDSMIDYYGYKHYDYTSMVSEFLNVLITTHR